MRVLVTGANGYLGRIIATDLHDRGEDVVGVVRTPATAPFQTVVQDLEGPDVVDGLSCTGHIDAVVHSAALLPGTRPDDALLMGNLRMTMNLAAWATRVRVAHVVFLSSSAVYGPVSMPADESSVPMPSTAYAVSKLACEHALRSMLDSSIILTCLRLSAPYGPGQKIETVVSRFLKQAMQGDHITMMGSGERRQTFVFESDVANAARWCIAARIAGTFNISSGPDLSMRNLAELCVAVANRSGLVRIERVSDDPQEAFRGIFPSDRAQACGYRPAIDLPTGLGRMARSMGASCV